MFTFLLILQTLVAVALVSVILMQRSEGGGLGVGGSSSSFMSARGAADFLTRATSILGAVFILLSISLAAIAGVSSDGPSVDTSLVNEMAPAPTQAPVTPGVPLAEPGQGQTAPAPQGEDAPAVPLAQ